MANANNLYCVERTGWNQWEDDGGRLVKTMAAARTYDTEGEAQNRADILNAEDGEDDSGDYQAVFYGYATPAC